MLGSSLFVLSALTLTGVYVNEQTRVEPEGYVVDFSTLEGDSETEQLAEIEDDAVTQIANSGSAINPNTEKEVAIAEEEKEVAVLEEEEAQEIALIEDMPIEPMIEELEAPIISLSFLDDEGLTWPIVGNVLLNYSMDKTIYFPTLQQYQYNPAIVIEATEGEMITAATDGQVIAVFEDTQIGNAVTFDLGSGYEMTYGQLCDIQVSEGDYVAIGDVIGSVASPTKYYAVEGANVYFSLTKDGVAVNPLNRLG